MEPSSPTGVGNFIISYQNSADYDLIESVNTTALLQYIKTSDHSGLDGTDSAFFPRVFTDADLIQVDDSSSNTNEQEKFRSTESDKHLMLFADNLDSVNGQEELRLSESSANLIPFTDNYNSVDQELRLLDGEEDRVTDMDRRDTHSYPSAEAYCVDQSMMEGRQSEGFTVSFQPDVISSNSNQRSGPDGSPSLIPSASRSYNQSMNPLNVNDTGELFAPVRTLTFSDIDQSSHLDDVSYMNQSRFVSTPERDNVQIRQIDGNNSHMPISGNGETAKPDTSDSDSENNADGGEIEFRQLVGEADSDLATIGAFDPSAIGLNREFMDNFTGRSGGGMPIDGDIFSPLGNAGFRMEDRHIQSRTPPLHSPAPNSPFANRFGHKSPRSEYMQNTEQMQFAMSPSRNPPDCLPNERYVRNQTNVENVSNNHTTIGSRQEYVNDQMYSGGYPNEHAFEPVENHTQRFVPKNLNEYFEHENQTNNTHLKSITKQFDMSDSRENEQKHTIPPNRQADGFEGDRSERVQTDSSFDLKFAEMSPSAFEQRYLQKTQVSVKLPQATYDTIAPEEFSYEERAAGDNMVQDDFEALDVQPDSLEGSDFSLRLQQGSKATPEKVVDLLQTQVSNLKDEAKSLETERSDVKNKTEKQIKDAEKENLAMEKYGNIKDENMNKSVANKSNNSIGGGGDGKLTANSRGDNSSRSQSHLPKTTGPQAHTVASKQVTQQNQPHSSAQYQPSARLRQETVAQKNKTSQKYVSNQPGMSKSAANLNKEFKKPHDVPQKSTMASTGQKSTGTVATAGPRKQVPADVDKGVKAKVSDKSKFKSLSNESLHQRSKTVASVPAKNSHFVDKSRGDASSHHLAMNQSQGQISRGPGHQSFRGHVPNCHSVDEGCETATGHVITQVENTSPVPVEPLEGSRCSHARLGSRPGHPDRSARVPGAGETSLDVRGMEDVRRQLQGMLRVSHDTMATQDRSQYEHSDIVAGFAVDFPDPNRQVDMSWDHFRKSHDDEMVDPFTSFSSQMLVDSGNVSRSDISLHAENQRLRDMLEKERYRRKHCEQYIQQLNVKLLETQQQVAVAVSMDKRKDIMIEQLDKQLAKVVEGWKTRDLEKDLIVAEAQKEKEQIEKDMNHQQEIIGQFEHNMSEALEALQKEKETSAHTVDELKDKVGETERAKSHTEELLAGEREKSDLLQQECDNLREGRDALDKKLDQMQRRLHREQDEWFQREQELLQRIEEVSEQNNKILQIEREKNEEHGKLAEEIMEQYQVSTTKVKKLEMELDAVHREKESVKVEMGIMEAKFENTQRSLEADLQAEMKKQIVEHVSEMQQKSERLQDEMRERHHQQVHELNQRHVRETEKQLTVFRNELLNKEEDFRKQLQELENRLLEYRTENTELKMSKQKLESSRLEILTKLQYTMQTQWNEALSLLATSPRKNPSQAATEDNPNQSFQSTIPTVNFNLHSPSKSTNQESPNRTTNQSTASEHLPFRLPPNQSSPLRPAANQDVSSLYMGGQAGVMNQSEERVSETAQKVGDDMNQAISGGIQEEVAIENAAMSHLKDFQDYMNSLTQTPEWISSINTQQQTDSSSSNQRPSDSSSSNQRPSPVDFATLLASHLQSVEQAKMTHPDISTIQSNAPKSQQPQSLPSNHRTHDQVQFSSLPTDSATLYVNKSTNQGSSSYSKQTVPSHVGVGQSENTVGLGHSPSQAESGVFSTRSEPGALWEGAPEMSMAVPIRPPQQGDDPYIHDHDHSIISSVAGSQLGYFQGGQSFSPPTKQNRVAEDDSLEDLGQQSTRLTEDYSDLSHRLAQHESHQNELQHYIQMLLHRSPNETANTGYPNDSMCSQDHETMDLNDTAQAAQLERELDRLQELRRKQEASKSRGAVKFEESAGGPAVTDPSEDFSHKQGSPSVEAPDWSSMLHAEGGNKILDPEQLAEIAKLLNQVKGTAPGTAGPTGDSQITQLLDVLRHVAPNQPFTRKGTKNSPKAAGPSGGDKHKGLAGQGDKHRGLTVTKKNVQYQPSKGVEAPKQPTDCSKHDKQGPKPTPAKKMERKVAGAATKGDKGPKPAAWK